MCLVCAAFPSSLEAWRFLLGRLRRAHIATAATFNRYHHIFLSVIGRHTSAASPSDKTCLKRRVDILSHAFLTLFSRGFSHFFFCIHIVFTPQTDEFFRFVSIHLCTNKSVNTPTPFFSPTVLASVLKPRVFVFRQQLGLTRCPFAFSSTIGNWLEDLESFDILLHLDRRHICFLSFVSPSFSSPVSTEHGRGSTSPGLSSAAPARGY